MELLETQTHYIINKDEDSLWFNRTSGSFVNKTCWDMAAAENPKCLGMFHGLIGKIQILPDLSPSLLLVSGIKDVGSIRNGLGNRELRRIYCIKHVTFLPLTSTSADYDLNLAHCPKHHSQNVVHENRNSSAFGDLHQKVALSKTFKTVTSTIKSAASQNKNRKDFRDKDRFEKRILDELRKMFEESDSFYFSFEADITNSIQHQSAPSYNISKPLWQRANEKFFWNKYMLEDFTREDNGIPDSWFIPIIQGYIQIETIPLDIKASNQIKLPQPENTSIDSFYTLTLISRRSQFMAGTRYKRRGVDEEGMVANYVETEQIITFAHHKIAFIQLRGSVPVFWSQPGFKYRPPPRLDRDKKETAHAFKKHFERELKIYEKVVCISLVEQEGKEKVIADAYLDNILTFNSPLITFISFDFHEFCRGLRYENVSVLLEGICDITNFMSFSWVDSEGIICKQSGVFRINCIDCLDRTNIVQAAIAKSMLENQFAKLGILPPDHPLPPNSRSLFQEMWANNGDTLSRQYAGTSALKGDFTRTGERHFTGLMKDGMNSANRYYLNRFKDAYRQAAIDSMLGNPLHYDLMSVNPDLRSSEAEEAAVADHVKQVIDDCKKLLVPDAETIICAWGLIDADPITGELDQTDMDVILVLTRDSFYVIQYDEETDRILHFERISLIDLDKIEVGPYTFQGMFKHSKTHFCIRLIYQVAGQTGYHRTFRSMHIRFFNNMAISIKTDDEIIESMKSIGDTFEIAIQMIGCEVEVYSGKLDRLKGRSKTPLANPLNLISPLCNFTRTSPDKLKSVGSRAFSNVATGLAKLNPMATLYSKRSEVSNAVPTSGFYITQSPHTSEMDSVPSQWKAHFHINSCGILISSCSSELLPSKYQTPPTKSISIGSIVQQCDTEPTVSEERSQARTPEILVSGEETILSKNPFWLKTKHQRFLPNSLMSSRLLKLSHSSDDVEGKDQEGTDGRVQRASSATDLDLQLSFGASSSSEGQVSKIGSKGHFSLSPLSPLNKEAVLMPFSVFAKGVQSLAPGAGRLAKGVQNISSTFDPRKLKAQRQQQLEMDEEMREKRLKCQSRIIQF